MPIGFLRSLVIASALVTGTHAMTGSAQTPAPAIPSDATWLSVSAQGESSRVPDVASLSVGVVTQAADSAAAMRSNAEQMNRVMAGIREAGIAEKDIRTSGVSLSPQYRYDQDRPPTITGYQASNTVTVKVRDIGNLGEVMDALAGQGANQIHGPNFEIDEPEPVYDEARLAALDKARSRASTYARALGMSVRRIVSISEGGGFAPPMPMKMMAMRAEAADAGTPVSPGENTVTVNLDVVFELVRGASAAR